MTLRLTSAAARALMLAAQGLLEAPARPATKADVRGAIQRMGALQIDTIHVVARSPYLVLWSRLGAYEPAWLDELLAEGTLFEYWSHAASFLPIEDYPLYRRLMLDRVKGWRNSHAWLEDRADEAERILARIAASGPVRSADFTRTGGKSNGWWDWKPEKVVLELLHATGALMIARRDRFQRLYDLRERVLPAWDDAQAPPLEDALRTLTLKTVQALGVTTAAWLPDYFRLPKAGLTARVRGLAAAGDLVEVDVDGWAVPGFVHRDLLPLAEAAADGALRPAHTALLSPFDPILWDRARVRGAFGFDYVLECYVPAAKRRYGYFTLAILHRGLLVGRLDAKAHRTIGLFEVHNLYLEPGIAVSDELVADLVATLRDCAAWHRTPEVAVRRSDPPALAAALTTALQ